MATTISIKQYRRQRKIKTAKRNFVKFLGKVESELHREFNWVHGAILGVLFALMFWGALYV